MAETDRGTDAEPEKPAAEPKSKKSKAKKTSADDGGGGGDAENGEKSGGTKDESGAGKDESKKGDGKKNGGKKKKENGDKENKKEEDQKEDGKKEEGKTEEIKKKEDMKKDDKKEDGKKDGKKEESKKEKIKKAEDKKEDSKKEEDKKEEIKKEEGKKEKAKKEEIKKAEDKKEDDKKKEGKNEIVKVSNGMKDGNNERNKTDPRLDDLMKLWMEFQATTKDSSTKIQKLESTLKTLETSLDRFGKFCGEYQLIWRVKGFSQRFDEARSGQRPIIYSPTFDTHRSGYKLQLSLCPNGDGKGNGVSLSLFFAILKGSYDSLLQWPFVCPVTMTLLEQVADLSVREPRDVTMTFVPNPRPDNMPFLGKPEEAKNLSLGFQKFIQLADLFDGEYIQDDSIFIKVYVDISNVMAM